MAFRHGNHGTLTHRSTLWQCPTCGQENGGRLEDGCPACKAGADAKKAPTAFPSRRQDVPDAVDVAFLLWLPESGLQGATFTTEHLSMAFKAGAAWATGNREPLPPPLLATAGGWTVALIPPDTHEPVLVDARTEATLLAALAFYRDSQLSYGAVPGQLTAAEITELIEKLSPKEAAV